MEVRLNIIGGFLCSMLCGGVMANEFKYYAAMRDAELYRYDTKYSFFNEMLSEPKSVDLPYYQVFKAADGIVVVFRKFGRDVVEEIHLDGDGRVLLRKSDGSVCRFEYRPQRKDESCYSDKGEMIYSVVYLYLNDVLERKITFGFDGNLMGHSYYNYKDSVEDVFDVVLKSHYQIPLVHSGK